MTRPLWALVFASGADAEARDFVEARAERGALLVTPRDFSRAGWRFDPDRPESSRLRVGELGLAADRISGALVRLPQVFAEELSWIAAEDRGYVAAEISAFLLALLAGLPAPVFNRPTPRGLAGPNLSPEGWRRLARRLGVSAARAPRRIFPDEPAESAPAPAQSVDVVGARCFGPPALRQTARALAQAAGADLLRAAFDADGALISADPRVNLGDCAVAEAVFALISPPGAERAA